MKKVIKNVLLSLCVLALVLQPLAIFAESSTYTTISSFVSAANAGITNYNPSSITYYFVDDYSEYNTLFTNCVSNYDIDISQIRYLYLAKSGNNLYLDIIVTPNAITYCDVTFRSNLPPYLNASTIGNSTGYRYTCSFVNNSYSYTYLTKTPTYSFQPSYSNLSAFDGCYPYNIYSFVDNNKNVYYLDLDNNSSGGDSGSSSVDLTSIEQRLFNLYMQNGLLISNNFRSYTPDGTPINSSWVGVGEYLTYMMECQQHSVGANKSITVSYTNQAGETVTKTNWLAWMGDWILQSTNLLSDIKNNGLSTLSDISDINDRLELAFPDDEIDLNNNIADSVKDNSTGHGLTASNISKGKDAVDEGISTFELDTSGSSYTSPFSALSDSDWSFWTQTTYNNLGYGYSFDSEAVLMESESDVYESNQNTLLNLLGW